MISTLVAADTPRARLFRSSQWLPLATLVVLAIGGLGSSSVRSQEASGLQGVYAGSLKSSPVRLHILSNTEGKVRAAFDNQAKGTLGMPCSDVRVDGDTLSFSVPILRGAWKGSVQNGGAMLSGTWTESGEQVPLTLTR